MKGTLTFQCSGRSWWPLRSNLKPRGFTRMFKGTKAGLYKSPWGVSLGEGGWCKYWTVSSALYTLSFILSLSRYIRIYLSCSLSLSHSHRCSVPWWQPGFQQAFCSRWRSLTVTATYNKSHRYLLLGNLLTGLHMDENTSILQNFFVRWYTCAFSGLWSVRIAIFHFI